MSTTENAVSDIATITINHKTAPEISDGTLSPAVLQEWEDQCRAFFAKRKIPEADEVREIVTSNCFKKDRIKHWIKINRAKLLEADYTFDMLLASLRKLFLVADWDQDILREVVNAKMRPDETFQDYSSRVLRGNNLLTGTTACLDEDTLRTTMTLNVSNALSDAMKFLSDIERAHMKAIKEFEEWLNYIERIDNGQRNNRRRHLEETEELISKRQRTSLYAPPAPIAAAAPVSGSNAVPTGWNSAQYTNPPPAQNVVPQKRAPTLTQEEKAVLDRHGGCFKCRLFFVYHNSNDCMNGFPDGNNYQVRTDAMALAQVPSPPVALVNVPAAQPNANATASSSTSRIEDVTTPPRFGVNAVLPSSTSFVLGNGSPSTDSDSDDE
ncbi:hypothetical protein BDZ97DRAFT_1819911, partial [Flammula alnicola]